MKKLFEIHKETMLSPSGVLDKAIDKTVLPSNEVPWIKKHFSRIIDRIGKEAYAIFLAEEQKAGKRAMELYFDRLVPKRSSRKDTIKIVARNFMAFDRFFLSLAQSRKPRAGSAFEGMIGNLFRRLKYPFAEQQVINGKPDFLMPNRKHYDVNPMDCIIFTVKTTLRERWRQIVTEGTRGLGFFWPQSTERFLNHSLVRC
ncbi:MAG TPA: type II restriction endonuclease [Candidatus Omnitrophota bacterium]|nr:MAG: Type-2 restriction enzyme EcoRII [Candidatus Omnitrophica bacterium ADurb.Bin314]HOE68532.1 type II restriction endonuclease [Candidatus Omnitrophota bacterium]HQB94322.1 type II restriction endonuclease [Candidatus Omnitrophota bacterium]